MAAGRLDILIEQGATWSLTLALKNSSGAPVDLTGYTGLCQIREKPTDASVLASAAVSFPNPTSGQVVLDLTAAQTASIAVQTGSSFQMVSTYLWDLLLTAPSGTKTRVVNGYANVSPGVTR